ncbi:MAG: bifunctional riboflavin kinase/FAD synthetase [Bacteroidota bacterium]
MRITRDIRDFGKVPVPVITVGTFDGLHMGHKKIISRLCESAKEMNGQSVLVTFHPHPRALLYPAEHNLRLLSSLNEKIHLLKQSGIDQLVIIPFTKAFAALTSDEFVKQYLVEFMGAKKLIVGYDHQFGAGRGGSYETLLELGKELDFVVEKIPPQVASEVIVSSTKVRNAIIAGEIKAANRLLGHEYPLTGTVQKGRGVGRQLGFPTANLLPDESLKLLPQDGVYAVNLLIRGLHYGGMMNIGIRPTFGKSQRVIEVNIFGFDRDIYGEEITVFFRDHVRQELRFGNAAELVHQLKIDREKVIQILSH